MCVWGKKKKKKKKIINAEGQRKKNHRVTEHREMKSWSIVVVCYHVRNRFFPFLCPKTEKKHTHEARGSAGGREVTLVRRSKLSSLAVALTTLEDP